VPDLNEFLNSQPKIEQQDYELEYLNGVRACKTCDRDVAGAYWDPIELVMSWKCSEGHDTTFKVQ
jgi:hypothetical protein